MPPWRTFQNNIGGASRAPPPTAQSFKNRFSIRKIGDQIVGTGVLDCPQKRTILNRRNGGTKQRLVAALRIFAFPNSPTNQNLNDFFVCFKHLIHRWRGPPSPTGEGFWLAYLTYKSKFEERLNSYYLNCVYLQSEANLF